MSQGQAAEWVFETVINFPFGYKLARLQKKFSVLRDTYPDYVVFKYNKNPDGSTTEKRVWQNRIPQCCDGKHK